MQTKSLKVFITKIIKELQSNEEGSIFPVKSWNVPCSPRREGVTAQICRFLFLFKNLCYGWSANGSQRHWQGFCVEEEAFWSYNFPRFHQYWWFSCSGGPFWLRYVERNERFGRFWGEKYFFGLRNFTVFVLIACTLTLHTITRPPNWHAHVLWAAMELVPSTLQVTARAFLFIVSVRAIKAAVTNMWSFNTLSSVTTFQGVFWTGEINTVLLIIAMQGAIYLTVTDVESVNTVHSLITVVVEGSTALEQGHCGISFLEV